MLPETIEIEVLSLFEFLAIDLPRLPIVGVDVFAPVIERLRIDHAVFFVKWDWQRSSRFYTCVVSRVDSGAIRRDEATVERAIAGALLEYAQQFWGFRP